MLIPSHIKLHKILFRNEQEHFASDYLYVLSKFYSIFCILFKFLQQKQNLLPWILFLFLYTLQMFVGSFNLGHGLINHPVGTTNWTTLLNHQLASSIIQTIFCIPKLRTIIKNTTFVWSTERKFSFPVKGETVKPAQRFFFLYTLVCIPFLSF